MRALLTRLALGAAVGALAGAALAPVAYASPRPAAAAPAAATADNTDSAVTVAGRGDFASMRFTVSQTRNLTDQAVTVSWTGGTPTTFAGTSFNTDFVQIMQCWGDDDGSVPSDPGPSRTHCEYGASPTTNRGNWPGNDYDDTRSVSYSADPTRYGQDDTYGAGMPFGQGEVPFVSVDGTVISSGTQNNELYSYDTTNEIDFGRTGANGTGQEIFETETLNQAPQLGCGAPVTHPDGSVTGRSCWLVIVPQGHLDIGDVPYTDTTQVNAGSPVSSTNWKNRVSVPLSFNPVGASCRIGAKELPTTGSELASDAMTSWQAKLCDTGTVYGYTELDDPDARAQLTRNVAQLAFTTDPLGSDAGTAPPGGAVDYAPVAVSGAVIGFSIERQPSSTASPAEQKLAGTRVQSLKLTPLLVAKLLTESYRNSPWGAVKTEYDGGSATLTAAAGYSWALDNPQGLISDPEFLALNPEFKQLTVAENPSTDTDLVTELGQSDAAQQLWAWVDANPAAREFLAGVPDAWGMRVNPYYSTNPDLNPTGIAFDPLGDSFPKSDPWRTIPPGSTGATIEQSMTDFHPYVNDMEAGAQSTRRGDQLWKSSWNSMSSPPGWASPGPQNVGQQFILSVTDSASAARYGLQTASLENSSGNFVAPTPAALTAAARTATASAADAAVKTIAPTTTVASAYPLAMLVYAAARPAQLTAATRASYATLLHYAATSGQTPGVESGDLPPGYAPLTPGLRADALAAATALAAWTPPAGGGTTTGGGTSGGTGTGLGLGAEGGGGGTGAAGGSAASAAAQAGATGGSGRTTASPALEDTATGITPADTGGDARYAVPVGAALGLLAALLAPFAGGARLRLRPAAGAAARLTRLRRKGFRPRR